MSNWRFLHKQEDLSVGMWPKNDEIYFTFYDVDNAQEVEFPITIEDLKHIIKDAEIIQKG